VSALLVDVKKVNLMASALNILFVVSFQICFVKSDIYFHNPRGSNNRLDEQGRARANANRLFDSQNNDRGGYNVGSLFYYQGSTLNIEWTNQHSCGTSNNHCELILQYMCDDKIRDGSTTQTIPTNIALCEFYDCDRDRRYGMHEDLTFYQQCSYRARNKGLFTADQNLKKRERSKNTRQNPGGTRRGLECPEERDYYPYWHPSPWVDIAVMTNDVSRCHFYKNQSQNVQSKWDCVFPKAVMNQFKVNKINIQLPNNKEDCEKYVLNKNIESKVRKPEWREFPAHNVPAPDCRETDFSRDNHLGNGIGGHPNTYQWTVPDNVEQENCVLRIRYNISTTDYAAWSTNSSVNNKIPMAEKFQFDTEAIAKNRGYVFKNNPTVKIFGGVDIGLQLAINTAQFGRTFQDRSHTFAIRKRPTSLEGETIHNLNVRGKRGNIVQVYPAVEYDFVPNNLEVAVDDYVHIQWTGSNTNPRNNDGQGLAGTDRSNIVLLAEQVFPEGNGKANSSGETYGHFGVNYPMKADKSTFLNLAQDDVHTLAFLDPGQMRGEMSELDDAGTYFNLAPRKVTSKGIYHYMCTRNNNFSNRDQKGKVTVRSSPFKEEPIGQMGGFVSLNDGGTSLTVEENTFSNLKKISIEKWSIKDGEAVMSSKNKAINAGDSYASDFIRVSPEELIEDGEDKFITITMVLTDSSDSVKVYRAPNDISDWTRVDAEINSGQAKVQAQRGGVYIARSESNIGMTVGIAVGCAALLVVILGTVLYFRRNPTKWTAVKTNCRNAERSLHSKV